MSLKDVVDPLQNGEAYADIKLVDDYLEHKRLPKIHDPMGIIMDRVPVDERKGALDLGACHGLLSMRASLMGWSNVVGVEIHPPSVDVFDKYLKPTREGVTLEIANINILSPEFEPWIAGMAARGLDTILARRIFCELFSTTFGKEGKKPEVYMAAGRRFGQLTRELGFKRIILEGRIWKGYFGQKRHHPMFKAEREMVALGPSWKAAERYEECAIMVPA